MKSSASSVKRKRDAGRLLRDALTPIGLAAMVIGAYGPWVAHANAGMALGVIDLAEFAKFMTRAGLTSIVREWFYLPLLAAAVGGTLWASQDSPHPFSSAFGKIVLSLAAGLALIALPPFYPDLVTAYWSPENRLLFLMSLTTLGLVVTAAALGHRLPDWMVWSVLIGLSAGSVALATWQFLCLSEPLAQLYGAPVQTGWGYTLTFLGSLSVITGSIMKIRHRARSLPDGPALNHHRE